MRPCLRRTTEAILGQALHEPGIHPGYHPVHLHHTVQESGQVGREGLTVRAPYYACTVGLFFMYLLLRLRFHSDT